MKNLSRLTALLLALLMLLATPVSALATTITIDDYNQAKENAEQANSQGGVPVEEESQSTVTVTSEGEAIQRETVEGAISEDADNSFTLPIAGKLVLSAGASANAYQWQILAQGVWASIVGENGASVTLTYALLENALIGNTAVVRCCLGEGESARYTAEATVSVDETVVTTPVVEENEVAVTSYYGEAPVNTYRSRLAALLGDGAMTYEADTPATYNIVINYRFENNVIAADSYTASLAAGSNFNATVTFPTVQGYLPYLDENQENSLELSFTAINQHYTYNVVYKPTNVNYTVIHYQQNLNDDKYTEKERETKQGLTNSTVPEVAKTYEGFYALLYEKPAIAADGSTVVEVYYDRYYYLMNFDLDGGYGVEPIYARYGAPIDDVGTPTKAGYSFKGWTLDGVESTIPANMPYENRTYVAAWQMNATAQVKVVLWGENPNDEGYSYLTTGELELNSNIEYTYNGTDQLYLRCDKEEHTHTAGCLKCGKVEHTQHTDDCINCGITEHPHDVGCWPHGDAFQPSSTEHYVKGTESNGSIGESCFIIIPRGKKYIYIDGNWYKYTGSAAVGSVVNPSCGKQEHAHTDTCYSCETHSHTYACYGCGKEEHNHDSNCRGTVAGLDNKLWKFVKSDAVTVNPDGSTVINVYYDRVSYSVQFYSNQNCTNEYTSLRITAKWGESILDKWPTYNGSSSWLVEGKGNTWQNSIQIMPVGGAKFWGPKTGDSSYKAYYYVEALPGDTDTIEHNGVTYKLHHTDTSSSSGSVTDEERYAIEGFTYKEGTANGSSYNGAKFYYTRHKYAIEFYSPTVLLKKTENVPYESPLYSYNWTPDSSQAPTKYEPGSVEFAGWYLNPDCTGVKFDFKTRTMPAGTKNGDTTLTLYAKWVPVTHTVSFYLDKNAFVAGTTLTSHPDKTVPHGSKIDPVPANPTNGSYTFVGWFYMDGDEEKAFDFANMPVTKDLQVYGKWSSNVLKKYTVYFKIQGTDTEIADPITGSGLAGITKTFDAKGDTELYDGYQAGYFPVTKSHSLTLDINATEENDTNVFTFWYVQKDAVPYTVKYLNKKTGKPVANEKTVSDNRKAVVTETFVPVNGMMPDAYQKRLVVSVDENGNPDTEHNVIIFYYTEDTTHAYYKITHYTENLATDTQGNPTWTEYASSQVVGDIGKSYTANSITIPGFTYNETVPGTVASGELTANGLELKLYYTRNSYPYQVRYHEQGTGKQLADPKNGTGKYGQVISENAIDIDNYAAVDSTPQTLTIKIEESQTEAKLNIITFYYVENEVTINYRIVDPDDEVHETNQPCGSLSSFTEGSIKVLSGTANGSTAAPTVPTYKFVGWYDNEECSGDSISTDPNFVPQKVDNKNVAATYYAKFDWDISTLTITKTGMAEGESAIFKVLVGGVTYTVVLTGEKDKTVVSQTISGLTIGSAYTVTETNWSWGYNPVVTTGNATGTITKDGITVSFTNTKDDKWLHDETKVDNVFTGTTTGGGEK